VGLLARAEFLKKINPRSLGLRWEESPLNLVKVIMGHRQVEDLVRVIMGLRLLEQAVKSLRLACLELME
jgi:hypothetical protein